MGMGTVQARGARNRIVVGSVPVDVVRFNEAVDRIQALRQAQGGAVFTPNVDHVVQAEADPVFRVAYQRVELSFADGQPVVWASRAFGEPLPDKVSGSDLLMPLMERAAKLGWRVFLLGGGEGVADESAVKLRQMGVNVVGTAAPMLPTRPEQKSCDEIVRTIQATRPDLVIIALGAPKQELLMDAIKERLRPAVLIGLGASLDFLIGRVQRAPKWMSRAGLEWLYRLGQEPKRMWRRYLVRDPAFVGIVFRQLVSRWRDRRALPR